MLFPTRNPYFQISIFLAVVFSASAGGFYLSGAFTADEAQPVVCHLPAEVAPPAPETFALEVAPDSREIFKIVDKMPLFPGIDCGEIKKYSKRKECADKAMLNYIYNHVKYPKKARESNVEGMAVVSFVIEKNGVITNIKILRDPGAGLGEAAAKTVRIMKADNTRFEPGLLKGKPVRVQYNLPVRFKLE